MLLIDSKNRLVGWSSLELEHGGSLEVDLVGRQGCSEDSLLNVSLLVLLHPRSLAPGAPSIGYHLAWHPSLPPP